MSITFLLSTNRDHPEIHWFLDSLQLQLAPIDRVTVLVIRPECVESSVEYSPQILVKHVEMKPSVWAGRHRLTKGHWWSKSNQLNTGLCLATTDWICTMDDRAVIMPGWLDHIRAAMRSKSPYALAGTYEKRTQMTVENGVIKHGGIVNPGEDSRLTYARSHWSHLKPPFACPGEWTYGCTIALPLEWAMEVNGFDETTDGACGEDTAFGLMLSNSGYPVKFEPRMLLVEDRTPGLCYPESIKKDFGVSPNDYSHMLLNLLKDLKLARHGFNLREVRKNVQDGKGWPAPWGPTNHLWDSKPLGEL